MNRPFLLRLLLSLVLLLSQQMATLHALEHLGVAMDARGGPQGAASAAQATELAKAVAQHQSCHQCLAFAQLAAPVASRPPSVVPPEPLAHGAARPARHVRGSDPTWASQARAPPLA